MPLSHVEALALAAVLSVLAAVAVFFPDWAWNLALVLFVIPNGGRVGGWLAERAGGDVRWLGIALPLIGIFGSAAGYFWLTVWWYRRRASNPANRTAPLP